MPSCSVIVRASLSRIAVKRGGRAEFEYWGTSLGGVWSEEVEGTNGIGTCIIEERPVTVHRSQHYRSQTHELELLWRSDIRRRWAIDSGVGRICHRS